MSKLNDLAYIGNLIGKKENILIGDVLEYLLNQEKDIYCNDCKKFTNLKVEEWIVVEWHCSECDWTDISFIDHFVVQQWLYRKDEPLEKQWDDVISALAICMRQFEPEIKDLKFYRVQDVKTKVWYVVWYNTQWYDNLVVEFVDYLIKIWTFLESNRRYYINYPNEMWSAIGPVSIESSETKFPVVPEPEEPEVESEWENENSSLDSNNSSEEPEVEKDEVSSEE